MTRKLLPDFKAIPMKPLRLDCMNPYHIIALARLERVR